MISELVTKIRELYPSATVQVHKEIGVIETQVDRDITDQDELTLFHESMIHPDITFVFNFNGDSVWIRDGKEIHRRGKQDGQVVVFDRSRRKREPQVPGLPKGGLTPAQRKEAELKDREHRNHMVLRTNRLTPKKPPPKK